MPAVLRRPLMETARKRRTHAKSRRGCGNCKLRRVKCDEGQPSCKKCNLYGVSCDYSGASLNLDAQGSFQVDFTPSTTVQPYNPSVDTNIGKFVATRDKSTTPWTPRLDSVSTIQSLGTIVDDSLRFSASDFGFIHPLWRFSGDQLGVLLRFRERTAVTIGNPQMAPIYRDPICQLACQHAFLMHMLLSITLMHDAHLANAWAMSPTKTSQDALKHWNVASNLFNEVLSRPIPPSYRDAIWATGVFLGAASFWSVGSTNPYEVWPLKSSEPDDLAWLKIGEGKKHLWRLAQPMRSDSIFCPLVKDNSCLSVPEWSAIDPQPHIATPIMKIFGITASSNESNNAYYQPVLTLSMCPNVKLTDENALKFLYIMAVITPKFFELLEIKDTRAIFIMGWWYILLKTGDLWWMSRRARIEGQAIRIWLRRQHGGDELADILDQIEQHSGFEEDATTWFFERTQI